MKKILVLCCLLLCCLTACGGSDKSSTPVKDIISTFEVYSRSFNEGSKSLNIKLYTNDYKHWNDKLEKISMNIGNKAVDIISYNVEVSNELVDDRYYVGKLELNGSFKKCSGDAQLTATFKTGETEEYNIGYISVGEVASAPNSMFGGFNVEPITKVSDGKLGVYGLLVHVTAYEDVTLWGLRMGLEHVYADTSLLYDIKLDEVETVRKLIYEGTLNTKYEGCYSRRPGNDSCQANFDLKQGEHYIYVPFQFENGFAEVKECIFSITYSAKNIAPAYFTTEEFTLIKD